jgi:hypothetical protein
MWRTEMDRIIRIKRNGRDNECPYSGFKPMKVTIYGESYSWSGHGFEVIEHCHDCRGCKHNGLGCCGFEYPRKS